MLLGFILAATSIGCLEREIFTGEPKGVQPAVARTTEEQPPTKGTDWLFIIDDSISMADKQAVLAASIEHAAWYATRCLSPDLTRDVAPLDGECPAGFNRTVLLPSFSSGSFGLITTSLEAGGEACAESNRRAHLAAPVSQEEAARTSGGQLVAQLNHVGEEGCGYEAPLEALYRFLVDPEPPARVTTRGDGNSRVTVAEGIDEELLRQRAAFLHPFSHLVIVILTDEDDCSVNDHGDAWKIGDAPGLAKGTAACANPDDPCCRSCDSEETIPPNGCTPLENDPICSTSPRSAPEDDSANLRCWEQRRRFGTSWLQPIERYTRALTSPTITARNGDTVPNPLFANGRTRDMITVLAITGVPSQLIARDDGSVLGPADLERDDIWRILMGQGTIPPMDAHLRVSVQPRQGLLLPGEGWDPIHGHEVINPRGDDLQPSCIFALPEPRACSGEASCECRDEPGFESPLCREADGSYGTVQRSAKAVPPSRILEFVRSLGSQGFLGSVCPLQTTDPKASGFGYASAFRTSHDERYGREWDLSCFMSALPVDARGVPKCKLLELHDSVVDCSALGRKDVGGAYREQFLRDQHRWDRRNEVSVCEIPAMPGDPRDPSSPAYACAHEGQPELDDVGYCYIDPQLDLGNPALVAACAAGHERRVRLLPRNLQRPGTTTTLFCDYGD